MVRLAELTIYDNDGEAYNVREALCLKKDLENIC